MFAQRDVPAVLSEGERLEIIRDDERAVLVNEAIQRRASGSTVEPQNGGVSGGVGLGFNEPVVQLGGTVGHVQVTRVLLGGKLLSPSRKSKNLIRGVSSLSDGDNASQKRGEVSEQHIPLLETKL